jgi:hypothetical protein
MINIKQRVCNYEVRSCAVGCLCVFDFSRGQSGILSFWRELLDVARMSSKDGEDSSHDKAHETFTICNKIELNYYFEVLLY